MKKSNLLILFLFVFSSCLNAQNYIHYTTGTSDFIEFYINEYGKEDVENMLNNISQYPSDSLINTLENISGKTDIMSQLIRLSNSSDKKYSYYQVALYGLLCYSELIERKVFWKDVYYYGGLIKRALGYYKSAIQDYSKALNYKSYNLKLKDYEIIGERGEIKNIIKDFYGAINDLTIGIDSIKINLSTNNSEIQTIYLHLFYKNRGQSYLSINKFDKALSDFSELIKITPDCGECYFLRGLTYLSMDNKSKGCIDLSKAGELEYDKAYEAINELCK